LSAEAAAPRRVLIAHPFALGDVVSALPLAGMLKRRWPGVEVLFVGTSYSRALIESCSHIDRFIDLAGLLEGPQALAALQADVFLNPYPDKRLVKLAWQARIPIRVGNLRRPTTLRYCNRFVSYSRAHSPLHTIYINLQCLRPLGFEVSPPPAELGALIGLRAPPLRHAAAAAAAAALRDERFKLVLHARSGGEGREWPPQSFLELARSLPPERYQLFLTGTATEQKLLQQQCPELLEAGLASNLMGQLSLGDFIAFLGRVDGFVASGTGPLHIAAALGLHTLGIFPPQRDIDPLRWAPTGRRAEFLCLPACGFGAAACAKAPMGPPCACTAAIRPQQVAERIESWATLSQDLGRR
jgi:ADP-heptose:LPS heptosyltransferase